MEGLSFGELTNPWPEIWPDPRIALPIGDELPEFPRAI